MDANALQAALDQLSLPVGANSDLQNILANIKSQSARIEQTYEASWLLTPFEAPKWETTADHSYKNSLGIWGRTNFESWDISLPNGCLLTDDKYTELLEACRKSAFLHRQGFCTFNPPSMSVWKKYTNDIRNFAQWIVLHEQYYLPEQYGFRLLDRASMRTLFNDLALGGWNRALKVPERIIQFLYKSCFGEDCPSQYLTYPYDLPQSTNDALIAWLNSQSLYGKSNGLINRSFLAKGISAQISALTSPVTNAILRQLEPTLQHDQLLLKGNEKTEFPSHRTPLLREVLDNPQSRSSFISSSRSLMSLFTLRDHTPRLIPALQLHDLADSREAAMVVCRDLGSTPFVPTKIAFRMINEAYHWINIGDDLVDFALKSIGNLITFKKSWNAKNMASDWNAPFSWNITQKLKEDPSWVRLADHGLKIEKINPRSYSDRTFEDIRNEPSLLEALNVWIGAVVLLIGTMKPSRDFELNSLSCDCLYRAEDGQYWLLNKMAKRTVGTEHANNEGRPIPLLTARAIQQLIRFGAKLKEMFGETDPYNLKMLFYIPSSAEWGTCLKIETESLNRHLEAFCDFIALPTDSLGRRWYIKIHEMRRWFLLLIVWSGVNGGISAARWQAGHTHFEHLHDYIKRDLPEQQASALEAEWVVDQLANLESSAETDVSGLVELRDKLLRDFDTKSLVLISERDWRPHVEQLLEENYFVEPIFSHSPEGHNELNLAIRARKAA